MICVCVCVLGDGDTPRRVNIYFPSVLRKKYENNNVAFLRKNPTEN